MLCGNDYNDLQFSRISRGMQGKNTDRTIPVALISVRNHMPDQLHSKRCVPVILFHHLPDKIREVTHPNLIGKIEEIDDRHALSGKNDIVLVVVAMTESGQFFTDLHILQLLCDSLCLSKKPANWRMNISSNSFFCFLPRI